MCDNDEVIGRVRSILSEAARPIDAPPPTKTPYFTLFLLMSSLFLAVWGGYFDVPWYKLVCAFAAGTYFLAGCTRLYAHSEGFESVTALLRKLTA